MAKKNETKKETKKAAVEIIRGRMALPLVYLVKFKLDDMTVSTLAAALRTTVGKINDIRKNANFKYVQEDYKPSEADIEAALARLEQCEAGEIVDMVKQLGAVDQAKRDEILQAHKPARKPRKKKDEATETTETAETDGKDALEELV
jgi:Asp-tRNA(Asn)/Glu-tRNA(Gln) amidotransferase C subunit